MKRWRVNYAIHLSSATVLYWRSGHGREGVLPSLTCGQKSHLCVLVSDMLTVGCKHWGSNHEKVHSTDTCRSPGLEKQPDRMERNLCWQQTSKLKMVDSCPGQTILPNKQVKKVYIEFNTAFISCRWLGKCQSNLDSYSGLLLWYTFWRSLKITDILCSVHHKEDCWLKSLMTCWVFLFLVPGRDDSGI